jgi:hypothetical protein
MDATGIRDIRGLRHHEAWGHVYFFIDRRIYGIGELVAVGPDCKYSNFPGASEPMPVDYEATRPAMLADGRDDRGRYARWVCLYRPSPHWMRRGVDMDDALSSNPEAFRMLRVIWKLSFIKFGDDENQAFRDALLKANQPALSNPGGAAQRGDVFPDWHERTHLEVEEKVGRGGYALNAAPILAASARGTALTSEMVLEAGIAHQLASGHPTTTQQMGEWDYLSHQVVASPFKPVDYMDKMDLFGYAYIPNYRPTIARYLVAELKKDTASASDLQQVMKYVDWVKDEYAHGDYSMIRAYLVAHSFNDDIGPALEEHGERHFTVERRPPRTEKWRNLVLLTYAYDAGAGAVRLSTFGTSRPMLVDF